MLIPFVLPTAATLAGTPSPEPDRKLVRAVYEEFVNINTSYSTGQTTPAQESVAGVFWLRGAIRF